MAAANKKTDAKCCVCWDPLDARGGRVLACCGKGLCVGCGTEYVRLNAGSDKVACPHCTRPLDHDGPFAAMIADRRAEIAGNAVAVPDRGAIGSFRHIVEDTMSSCHKAFFTCRCPRCLKPIVRNGGCHNMTWCAPALHTVRVALAH